MHILALHICFFHARKGCTLSRDNVAFIASGNIWIANGLHKLPSNSDWSPVTNSIVCVCLLLARADRRARDLSNLSHDIVSLWLRPTSNDGSIPYDNNLAATEP